MPNADTVTVATAMDMVAIEEEYRSHTDRIRDITVTITDIVTITVQPMVSTTDIMADAVTTAFTIAAAMATAAITVATREAASASEFDSNARRSSRRILSSVDLNIQHRR